MATTGYNDRIFVVEVSGLRQPALLSTSHCTFKVAYPSLSRTLQLIRRNGGTIVSIHAVSLAFPEQADTLDVGTIAAQPLPPEAEAIAPEPSALSKSPPSKSPPSKSPLSKLVSFFRKKLP